jgi:hypothetical protein
MITKRTIKDLPKPVQKGINFIKITKHVNLVGSSSIKELHYTQDFDINELFQSDVPKGGLDTVTPSHILHLFQQKYQAALKNPSVVITDFKLGAYKWTCKDIMNGYINHNRKKLTFEELLFYKNDVLKMDIIYIHPDNRLSEITDVYEISLNGQQNFQEDVNIEEKLEEDILQYEKEGNLFKALKRSFSLLLLQKKPNKKMIRKYLNFFNSPAGLLYNIEYGYTLVELLRKQKFKKISKEAIIWNENYNNERLKKFGITKSQIRSTLNNSAKEFVSSL